MFCQVFTITINVNYGIIQILSGYLCFREFCYEIQG